MQPHRYLLALPALLLACQDTPEPPQEERGLSITVAPLTLTGVSDVTYGLTVRNGLDQVVWTRPELSSTRFGNGQGDLAYVGPCDASSNPHSVALQVVAVIDSDGTPLQHPGDYFNPTLNAAGEPDPIILAGVTCVENADTPVAFNLTLMRAANQGFFDVAVNFDSIFCSAKLDCQEAFLHHGATRAETAVLAFACAAGPSAADPAPTVMYLSDIALTCTDAEGLVSTQHITPSAEAEGNQGAAGPHIFQWGQYFGQESFDDLEKCYWNTAIGLDLAAIGASTCTVTAVGTATSDPLPGDALPEGAVYPVIAWEVDVTTEGALCAPNPLNATGSGVQSVYLRPGDQSPTFSARYPCGQTPEPTTPGQGPIIEPPIGWACGSGNLVEAALLDGGVEGFTVTIGGLTSAPQALPEGAVLAAERCCEAPCCAP